MKKYFMYISMALFISGCSGGGGSGDSSFSEDTDLPVSPVSKTIEVGEEIFVGSGDSIVPNSSDTEIVVSHYLNDTKSVKVLSGSVTLLSGNYDAK